MRIGFQFEVNCATVLSTERGLSRGRKGSTPTVRAPLSTCGVERRGGKESTSHRICKGDRGPRPPARFGGADCNKRSLLFFGEQLRDSGCPRLCRFQRPLVLAYQGPRLCLAGLGSRMGVGAYESPRILWLQQKAAKTGRGQDAAGVCFPFRQARAQRAGCLHFWNKEPRRALQLGGDFFCAFILRLRLPSLRPLRLERPQFPVCIAASIGRPIP